MYITSLPKDTITDELEGDTLLVFLLPEECGSRRLRDYIAEVPLSHRDVNGHRIYTVRTADHPEFCDDFGIHEEEMPCLIKLRNGRETLRNVELDICVRTLFDFCGM